MAAKLIEEVRGGAYATIRSPLSRTLLSSSESKSCGRPFASRPSAVPSSAGGSANSRGGRSKSAGVAGRPVLAGYAAASAAAAEAGALVGATLAHATGGVLIAFAEVLEDA